MADRPMFWFNNTVDERFREALRELRDSVGYCEPLKDLLKWLDEHEAKLTTTQWSQIMLCACQAVRAEEYARHARQGLRQVLRMLEEEKGSGSG